jgi:hypothetical protein
MTITDYKKFLAEQFKINTGVNMLDSGGDNNRRWQKNADKSIKDFDATPEVELDDWTLDGATDTSDAVPTVSTWHYMLNNLEIDDLCAEFNAIPCDNWNSDDAYGLSTEGQEFLESRGFKVQDAWNSYNGESNLDYVLQGASVLPEDSSNFEFPEYMLIQLHLGADVRGGYTDAKLYRITSDYFDTNPSVYGTIDGVEVETSYNGYNLTDGQGNDVPLNKNSKIELSL